MATRISSIDQDTQILESSHQRSNVSVLSGRYQPKQKSNNYSIHIVYISIIVVLACALLYLNLQPLTSVKEEKSAGMDSINKEMKRLSDQLSQLKGKTQGNVQQIQNVKNNVNKIQAQPQNQPKPPPPSNQGLSTIPAPQTVNKNRPKSQYMTPALQKIGEKRKQAEGMKPVANKTVSQIQYLKKNKDKKTIEQVLYDEKSIQGRKKFHEQRIQFLNLKKNLRNIYLSSYNNHIDQSRFAQQLKTQTEQYNNLDKYWNFSKYTQELPMCLIVPGYNNNAKFRIQYNLNSIFQQNYTNYFAVIINDASTDNSDETYRKYFQFYNIDPSTYAYVENKDRKTALENIYTASHQYCSKDSIAVNIDADDEFIGKNVLKIFNAGYQLKKAGVLYSNFYWYDQGRNIMLGFTSQYTENDKKNANYRKAPQRFSHLRSFRNQLFIQIDARGSFQDDQGKFFTSAYDMAMYFPLMQKSCGRVNKIDGYHYLYNINTGLNDYATDRNKQVRIDQAVRRRPKLNCSIQFDQKMKKQP